MHLFPEFQELKHEFLQVDVDPQAQRPIWCGPVQRELPHTLGETNKALVLDTLWKAYRWQELRERIDESAEGEHVVLYWKKEGEAGGGRRLLVSTAKIQPIDRQRGNIYNEPFFRQHLWDEDALIESAQLQVKICQFTGVQPRNARRIADTVEALGPRIREVIRFTVAPAANRANRAECIFECLWRFLSSLHERGVDFVIAISEARSAVMRLYEVLGERLGRAVILPVAKSMLLNREIGVERETVLYFTATAPFRQHVPSLSADDLAWIIHQWVKPRKKRA
jgi:hypothetical protein